jgi:hypothetical protein
MLLVHEHVGHRQGLPLDLVVELEGLKLSLDLRYHFTMRHDIALQVFILFVRPALLRELSKLSLNFPSSQLCLFVLLLDDSTSMPMHASQSSLLVARGEVIPRCGEEAEFRTYASN